MRSKFKFSYLKMQAQRPRRLHSNTVFVRNFVKRILASQAVPLTAEQIRLEAVRRSTNLRA